MSKSFDEMRKSLINDFRNIENDDSLSGKKNQLARYLFLRKVGEYDRALWREMVLKYNLVGSVYTPAVAGMIKNAHKLNDYFDQKTLPLRLNFDYSKLTDKDQIKNHVKQSVVEYMHNLRDFYAENFKDTLKIEDVMENLCIVLTDGERILGIGDQGINGAEISFGKLACYHIGSGLPPEVLLPIGIDVGTNNKILLGDEGYDGYKDGRIRGDAYNNFTNAVVEALAELNPRFLQFEDFKGQVAYNVLNLTKQNIDVSTFNDDIEGTAAVIVQGIITADQYMTSEEYDGQFGELNLTKSNFLFSGFGGAGVGIANLLKIYLKEKSDENPNFFFEDSVGLAYKGRKVKTEDGINEFQEFQKDWLLKGEALEKVIEHMKNKDGWEFGNKITTKDLQEVYGTDVLIGTTTQPDKFNPKFIEKVRENTYKEKCIMVLALSNPTDKCEILTRDQSNEFNETGNKEILKTASKNILDAAKGKAIIGTGSPFPKFDYRGMNIEIGQANNVFQFPGIGYGLYLSGASKMTDRLFIEAAKAGAKYQLTREEDLKKGRIYPNSDKAEDISMEVALHLAKTAIEDTEIKTDEKWNAYSGDQLLEALKKEIDENHWFKNVKSEPITFDDEKVEKLNSIKDFVYNTLNEVGELIL